MDVEVRYPVPEDVYTAAVMLIRQREDEHPGRYDMVDQGHIDTLVDYVKELVDTAPERARGMRTFWLWMTVMNLVMIVAAWLLGYYHPGLWR